MPSDRDHTLVMAGLPRATDIPDNAVDAPLPINRRFEERKSARADLRGAVLSKPAVVTPFGPLARHVVTEAGDIVEASLVGHEFLKVSVAAAKVFGDGVALAWPMAAHGLADCVFALYRTRKGEIPVEVRIGVGPIHGEVPLRVLGYAGRVAEAIQSDLRILVEPVAPRIKLFSSAPKAGHFDGGPAIISLVALAGALRIAGINNPISIDLASSDPEIPVDLDVDLGVKLADWVVDRAVRHRPGETPSFLYALEHASPTMFGDIAESDNPPFLVTVGGATEARFWAARMRVRAAAAARGARLAPAAGIIIKTLRVPWYQPQPFEPPLSAARTPAEAAQALAQSANPARGGNAALKGESRTVWRLVNSEGVSELIDAICSVRAAMSFARDKGFDIGARLVQATGDDT